MQPVTSVALPPAAEVAKQSDSDSGADRYVCGLRSTEKVGDIVLLKIIRSAFVFLLQARFQTSSW